MLPSAIGTGQLPASPEKNFPAMIALSTMEMSGGLIVREIFHSTSFILNVVQTLDF
jgi:hypothetical protein